MTPISKDPSQPPTHTMLRGLLRLDAFSRQFEEIAKAELRGGNRSQPTKNANQDIASQHISPGSQGSVKAFSQQFDEIENTEGQETTFRQRFTWLSYTLGLLGATKVHRSIHGDPCDLRGCHFLSDYYRCWGPQRLRKQENTELLQTMRVMWATERDLLLTRVSQERVPAYPQTRKRLRKTIEDLDALLAGLSQHSPPQMQSYAWTYLHLLSEWRLHDARVEVEEMQEKLVSSGLGR